MNPQSLMKENLVNLIDKVLFNEETIQKRVREMGEQITQDYMGKDLLIACILKGAIYFTADLIRQVKIPLTLDFISVSSYGDSTKTSGIARITKDLDEDVEGKHIIITEDIVDTGLTLNYLIKLLKLRNPASIKVCALLDKLSRRIETDVKVDYVGFSIPNVFVVGYGLDYHSTFRHLPFVCTFRENSDDLT